LIFIYNKVAHGELDPRPLKSALAFSQARVFVKSPYQPVQGASVGEEILHCISNAKWLIKCAERVPSFFLCR